MIQIIYVYAQWEDHQRMQNDPAFTTQFWFG